MYPFDHQECEMDFVDWTYDGRFVMLLNGSHEIGMDVFKKHGEWEIVRTKSFETNQFFDSDPGIPFPTVKFVFYLRRKPKFYLINVVAPCILMSVLASLEEPPHAASTSAAVSPKLVANLCRDDGTQFLGV